METLGQDVTEIAAVLSRKDAAVFQTDAHVCKRLNARDFFASTRRHFFRVIARRAGIGFADAASAGQDPVRRSEKPLPEARRHLDADTILREEAFPGGQEK